MSTQRTKQVLDESVDAYGVSIATSLATTGNSRTGVVYGNSTIPAGVLVHCHRMNDGTILAVFGTHWTNVTQGPSVQAYTDYEVSHEPVWHAFDPATGSPKLGPWSNSLVIPTPRTYTTRSLVSACSRGNYLYLLQQLDGLSYLQFFNLDQSVTLMGEEFLSTVEGEEEDVTFGTGIYVDNNYLMLVGRGQSSDQIYLARKPWAVVGVNRTSWEYFTEDSWQSSLEGRQLVPEKPTTLGPVSAMVYKNVTYLLTLVDESGQKSKLWKRDSAGQWSSGTTISLEDVGYNFIAPAYLQPLLPLNTTPPTYSLPYVVARHITTEIDEVTNQESISNHWDIISIQ